MYSPQISFIHSNPHNYIANNYIAKRNGQVIKREEKNIEGKSEKEIWNEKKKIGKIPNL